MTIPLLCLNILFMTSGNGCQEVESKSNPPKSDPKSPYPTAVSAEDTLRVFLIASFRKDEAKLKELTRPNDEIAWLLKDPISERVAEQLEKQIRQIPIRSLKPGDSVTRKDGRVETVEPGDVSSDRAVLMFGQSIFYHLRKVDGKWYVDPTRMIAMRKSNDAFLKKQAVRKNDPT